MPANIHNKTSIKTAQELKDRQRAERENYPDSLGLRIHRAISWLFRAEMAEDLDGRFVFLWISFNSAYSNELGRSNIAETEVFGQFFKRMVALDQEQKIYHLVWSQYHSAIRVLLDNKYVYQPFWHFHNKVEGYENWEETFKSSKRLAHRALAQQNTASVLEVIFSRLYTLRNQIIHGGATYNSSSNRDQLRDATGILEALVPIMVEIMMNNSNSHWGEACYPVVD